jgi:hypothetical protein
VEILLNFDLKYFPSTSTHKGSARYQTFSLPVKFLVMEKMKPNEISQRPGAQYEEEDHIMYQCVMIGCNGISENHEEVCNGPLAHVRTIVVTDANVCHEEKNYFEEERIIVHDIASKTHRLLCSYVHLAVKKKMSCKKAIPV